ncbi:MAG TPA: hypothetical protein VEL28_02825 [Candidatus Binatia bacterium]|nr:hypothetical protein [Candidatus Binatia bacterium]
MPTLSRSVLGAAAAAFVLTALPAPAEALSENETECRLAIAKSMATYTRAVLRVTKKCHHRRSSGKLESTIDCNDLAQADTRNKLPEYRTLVLERIGGAGSPCAQTPGLLSRYPSCPAPAQSADNGGATTGIDSFAEVAQCLMALTDEEIGALAAETAGSPQSTLSEGALACQTAISEGIKKIVKRYMRERRLCQRNLDQSGGGIEYSCDGQDPEGRIAQARTAASNAIATHCALPSQELDTIGSCGNTVAELQQCVISAANESGGQLIENAYELPGATTTTTFGGPTTTVVGPTTTLDAPTTTLTGPTTTLDSPTTTLTGPTTTLDAPTTTLTGPTTTLTGPTTTLGGPTTTTLPEVACADTFPLCTGACGDGQFCGVDGSACVCAAATGECAPATIRRTFHAKYEGSQTSLSTGWTGTAHDVDIPGGSQDTVDVVCDDQCQSCDVSLNVREGEPASNCRCAGDPQTACTVINGPDPDNCPALDTACNCYFGSPLAISAGGTPVCVTNEILEDYSGTMNLRTGEWFERTKLASVVHLGADVFNPCPLCEGDATPNDGIRGGSCSGGLEDGQACDVNGIHQTFGPTSFDCPPPTLSNISGSGLLLDLKFSTGPQTLAYDLPCDTPSGQMCPCRVCSGNSRVGCSSNADCIEFDAGECTAGGGAGVQPNECTNFACADSVCTEGPIDTFCDGVTHPDGRGFITCVTSVDCQALGAGQCTVQDLRRCYDDPISVSGDPDIAEPIKASIFCIPPTTSPAVNSSGGLPGPGVFKLDFDADVRCQNDPSKVYDFPSGSNCNASTTTTLPTGTTLPPLTTTIPDVPTTVPLLDCAEAAPPLCIGVCSVGSSCTQGLSGCQCAGLGVAP